MSLETLTLTIPSSLSIPFPSMAAVIYCYFMVGAFFLAVEANIGLKHGYSDEVEGFGELALNIWFRLIAWPAVLVVLYAEYSEKDM